MENSPSPARLDPHLDVFVTSPVESRRLHTIYYDTGDLRLTRWGCSLRFRLPDAWTLTLLQPGPTDAGERTEHVFRGPGESIPAGALDLATAYLRGARPLPVAELRTLRALELATPGAASALGALAELPELVMPKLNRSSSAGDLFRGALATSALRLVRSDVSIRLGTAPEGVHQARVAVRRIRSDLKTFLPVLDAAWAAGLRERMRWLGDGLGAARDADVLLERLQRQAQCLPDVDRRPKELVLDLLRGVRNAAYDQLRSMLRERRYVGLIDELLEGAQHPQFNERAGEPARDVVPELMEGAWRTLRIAVQRRSRPATDTELHDIRIKAKRARYAAEAMLPVSGRAAQTFAARVSRLQSILGDHHDAVLACGQLRAHIGGGDGAFVAGELTSLENDAATTARERWRKAWRAARARDLRFWEQ